MCCCITYPGLISASQRRESVTSGAGGLDAQPMAMLLDATKVTVLYGKAGGIEFTSAPVTQALTLSSRPISRNVRGRSSASTCGQWGQPRSFATGARSCNIYLVGLRWRCRGLSNSLISLTRASPPISVTSIRD